VCIIIIIIQLRRAWLMRGVEQLGIIIIIIQVRQAWLIFGEWSHWVYARLSPVPKKRATSGKTILKRKSSENRNLRSTKSIETKIDRNSNREIQRITLPKRFVSARSLVWSSPRP